MSQGGQWIITFYMRVLVHQYRPNSSRAAAATAPQERAEKPNDPRAFECEHSSSRSRSSTKMTAAPEMKPHLDPKVGEALCDEQSVVQLMQSPKMAEALAKLKKDPQSYQSIVQGDPELAEMFGRLRMMMEEKEQSMASQQPESKAPSLSASAYAPVPQPATAGPPALHDEDVPALQSPEEIAAETAKAEGTAAFEAGDYALAETKYERVCALQPTNPPHWSNLAVARLRGGKAEAAVEAARESTRLNPRFAKGWLRLGEALHATGDLPASVSAYESGLQRAEGAIRLALTKGLQKAKAARAEAAKPSKDPRWAEEAAKASGAKAGGGTASATSTPTPAAAAPKKELPALPTFEDEKRIAAETAALRAKTEDSMKKYAEMAKQQTLAAAAARAKKAEERAAAEAAKDAQEPAAPPPAQPAAKPAARKVVVVDEESSDDERIVDVTEELTPARKPEPAPTPAPAPAAAAKPMAPKLPAAAAIAPARKVMIEELSSEDEGEHEKGQAAASSASKPAPPVAAAAPKQPQPAAEGMFAAALEEWSEGNKQKSAPPSPAKPTSPAKPPSETKPGKDGPSARKGALPLPSMLSNDLIFDLA